MTIEAIERLPEQTFEECKADWLRVAGILNKAKDVDELAALLLADTAAPYHSFDLLATTTVLTNLGDRLGMLILECVDRHAGDEGEGVTA